MKTLGEFLDRAKEITGSYYKTAQRLKMTRSGISHARKSGSMDSGNAVELAKILDINPVEVIAACDIAKKPENREFWGRWVAAGTAVAAILTALIFRESGYYSMAYALFVLPHTIDYAQFWSWYSWRGRRSWPPGISNDMELRSMSKQHRTPFHTIVACFAE